MKSILIYMLRLKRTLQFIQICHAPYYYASKELKLFCFQTDMNIVHRISKSEYIS